MINQIITQLASTVEPKHGRLFFLLLVLVLFILGAGAPAAIGGVGG
ncbi:MAG: hypothetical protein GYA17_16240 [Chloroflexi bacterium]|jgi:hypothetical protein|nr:hypothetical protein [Anaerolineaceae bacterium]NMB89908.1 hypothetical protein [Chloroflexota bacterium]